MPRTSRKTDDPMPIMGRHGKDEYSGIEGTIRGIKILHSGCVHVLVHPKGTDAFGIPKKAEWFDKTNIIGHELFPEVERPDILGKEVVDTITGYKGTVVSMTKIEGYDDQVEVQGKTFREDGTPSPTYGFDLSRAKRVDKEPVKKTNNTGSPAFMRGL